MVLKLVIVGFRLEITKEFMLSEVKRLADLSKKNNEDPDLHAALGSFHEKLRNFDEAKLHLEKAILLNNAGFYCNILWLNFLTTIDSENANSLP